MNQSILLALPVFLPVLAGILTMALPPLKARRARQWFLGAALVLNTLLVLAVVLLPDGSLTLLRLTGDLAVRLRTDNLSRMFCLLVQVLFLLVGFYSFEYVKHENNEERFLGFLFISLGTLMGVGLSSNLLTLYLFFESMTLLSMPLVLHSMTRESIAAAFKYLFYSIAGASLGLIGFFILYSYNPTLEFTPGGVLEDGAGGTAVYIAVLLAVVGFGAKAGMFPLHAWLPAAHPVAPAPASAILSGVITKAGVFAILRFTYYLVGPDLIRGTWVQYTWIVLTLATIFMGSILAFKEPLLKRRLAYSSISQVSYILFGLSTLTFGGVLGALLHVVFHAVTKNALFLTAGSFNYTTDKIAVSQLRGIGKHMPVTLWCFTLVSITLVGIPPTSGFLSKWYLATGSLAADTGVFSWLGPAFLLFSALLTAGYLLPIAIHGFFPGPDCDPEALLQREPHRLIILPVLLLSISAVLLGIFPGGLLSYLGGIARSIL